MQGMIIEALAVLKTVKITRDEFERIVVPIIEESKIIIEIGPNEDGDYYIEIDKVNKLYDEIMS